SATPRCALERVPIDLANPDARRGLFNRLGRTGSRALVLSEGLRVYLMSGEVCALGQDLAAPPSFTEWIVDIASPGLLKMLQERTGAIMAGGGAPLCLLPHR